MFALPYTLVIKVTSGDNSYYGQGPKFKSFKGVVKVSPEPTGFFDCL